MWRRAKPFSISVSRHTLSARGPNSVTNTVPPIVRLGELQVRGQQFDNRDRGTHQHGRGGLALDQPLGEETVVTLATFGRAVRAEVLVAAIERDDRLTGGLVQAVSGGGLARPEAGFRPESGSLPGFNEIRGRAVAQGRVR